MAQRYDTPLGLDDEDQNRQAQMSLLGEEEPPQLGGGKPLPPGIGGQIGQNIAGGLPESALGLNQAAHDMPLPGGDAGEGPEVPGLQPSAPAPRTRTLGNGAIMTTNDPTVGLMPEGGGAPQDAYGKTVGPDPSASAAPDYKSAGQFANRQGNWSDRNSEKYRGGNFDDMSERYQIMQVLSHFDPNQGITPEVLAALNAAGIKSERFGGGKLRFSGQGDKLSINGMEGDVIGGFNDPNNQNKSWGAWANEAEGGGPEQHASMPGGGGDGALAPQSPFTNNPIFPQDSDFFTQLMEQLGKQTGVPMENGQLDRNALMNLLG